ncbi:hypothetical protein V8C86DRAFT_347970 [Haematococcus lacustris]
MGSTLHLVFVFSVACIHPMQPYSTTFITTVTATTNNTMATLPLLLIPWQLLAFPLYSHSRSQVAQGLPLPERPAPCSMSWQHCAPCRLNCRASLGVLTWDRHCSSGSSMTLGPEPQPPAAPVQALGTWVCMTQAAVQDVSVGGQQ